MSIRNTLLASLVLAGVAAVAMSASPVTAGTDGAFVVAKHGADNAAGDDRGGPRGGNGKDDGPNHTSVQKTTTVARNGADNPKGDDRGNHGPNHG